MGTGTSFPGMAQEEGGAVEGETPVEGILAPGPQKQGYILLPTLVFSETATDNARGTAHARQGDFISTLSPGFIVSGEGARSQGQLAYAFSYDKYAVNSDLDGARHSMLGVGSTEIIRPNFFVDGSASISEELIDARNAVTATDRNLSSNQATVVTYRVQPRYRETFENFAVGELRYALGQTYAEQALSDATRHEFGSRLTSGPSFTRLLWNLDANYFLTERGAATTTVGPGSTDTERSTLLGNVQYVLTREYSLLGSVGYERISDNGLSDQPNGIIGSVGVEWQPGPRTRIRVLGNHRYNSNYASLQATHQLGTNTLVTATYDEGISSGQDRLLNNVSALGTDQQGNFVDNRNQQPFEARNTTLGLNNLPSSSQHEKIATLVLTGGTDYTTYILRYRHNQLDADLAGNSETSDLFGLSVSRQIGPFSSLFSSASYARNNFGTIIGTVENSYSLSAGYQYQLTPTVSGTFRLASLLRFSSADGAGSRENTAVFSLRKQF